MKYTHLADAFRIYMSEEIPFDEKEIKPQYPPFNMVCVSSLSKEAQFVINLILKSPNELANLTLDSVRNYLRDTKKWKWITIQLTFKEIRKFLKNEKHTQNY